MKILLKNIARKFGYQISKLGNVEILLESFIFKYAQEDSDFFFVQIGANNGIRYDPIYSTVNELKLKGIVIEPIKEYYEELVKNYQHLPSVKTANVAIYAENKELTFYKVKKNNDLPDWVNGIASLDEHHHIKANTPSEYIEREQVVGIDFDTLIKGYSIDRIDFLQIDTEGYDYHLLKMFPFDKFKPKLIHFEHSLHHQVMSFEQYNEINAYLISLGYKTIMTHTDTICYLDV